MSKEWICRVCHKLIMDGKCDCAAIPPVRSEPLLADLRDLKRELEIAVNSQLAGPEGRAAFRSCLGSINTILDKHGGRAGV